MMMWELTSNEPPFSNYPRHDKELVLDVVVHGIRPKIIEGTPEFYAKIMQQCWNSDPLQRPDASLLPKLFEEMMELCKVIDNNKTDLSRINVSLLTQHNPATNLNVEPGTVHKLPLKLYSTNFQNGAWCIYRVKVYK